MISSTEYIFLCQACQEVMPKLAPLVNVDYFYANLDHIRKENKVLIDEFAYFKMYPRADMEKFQEAVDILRELCPQTDVDAQFIFPQDVKLGEVDWASYRQESKVVKFYFKGVDITPIIDF